MQHYAQLSVYDVQHIVYSIYIILFVNNDHIIESEKSLDILRYI